MLENDFIEEYKRGELARRLTLRTNHERRMEGILEGFYAQALQMSARKEEPKLYKPLLDMIDKIEAKLSSSKNTND